MRAVALDVLRSTVYALVERGDGPRVQALLAACAQVIGNNDAPAAAGEAALKQTLSYLQVRPVTNYIEYRLNYQLF